MVIYVVVPPITADHDLLLLYERLLCLLVPPFTCTGR